MTTANRRRYPRYPHVMSVQLTVGKRALVGTTQDVSLQGLFVDVKDGGLAVRQLVRVRLFANDPHPLEVVAVVARVVRQMDMSTGLAVGLQFMTMDPDVLERWSSFVAHVKLNLTQEPLQPAAAAGNGATPPSGTHPCFPATLVLQVSPPAVEDITDLFSLDLAGGSVLLRPAPQLEPGTAVVVRLIHPQTGSALDVDGRVFTQLKPDGLAVALTGLSPGQRMRLHQFMTEMPVDMEMTH